MKNVEFSKKRYTHFTFQRQSEVEGGMEHLLDGYCSAYVHSQYENIAILRTLATLLPNGDENPICEDIRDISWVSQIRFSELFVQTQTTHEDSTIKAWKNENTFGWYFPLPSPKPIIHITAQVLDDAFYIEDEASCIRFVIPRKGDIRIEGNIRQDCENYKIRVNDYEKWTYFDQFSTAMKVKMSNDSIVDIVFWLEDDHEIQLVIVHAKRA